MKKILVVEDEHTLREDIMSILKLSDFEVVGAENGIIGIQQAREHRPDIIVCDVMMPEGSGDWMLIEVRSDPITARIPFIFLTAKTTRADMRRGMELGADDYITKPFRADELLQAIHVQLEKYAAHLKEQEHKLEELRQSAIRALPHELRTPLTGILGYSRMLMEDAAILEADHVYQMARGIERAANRMRRLVENCLFYAQLEYIVADTAKVAEFRTSAVTEPRQIIEEVVLRKATQAQRTHDVVFDCQNVRVQISEAGLQKITEELIDNAIKFSAAGSPVQVTTTHHQQNFMLMITDHGRGMSADQIASIGAYMQFERRFYEHPGLGLGLVIAKRTAELYGGGLKIVSQPEQETSVSVVLPAIA